MIEVTGSSPVLFLFLYAKFANYIMKETVSSVGERYLKMVEVAGGNPVLFLFFLYAKTTFYIMEKSDHEKLFEEVIL